MTGTCTYCNERCEVVVVDFGVGPYEFWGARGWDSLPAAVSNCCEAKVVDQYGVTITLHDLEEGNA